MIFISWSFGEYKIVKLCRNGRKIYSFRDKNICLWGVDNGKLVKTFKGHTSRIWDLNSNKNGSFIVSASSDRTIKLWSVFSEKEESIATLSGHVGDVYTCFVHSAQSHIISGGYDKKVCIFDIEREELLQTFVGHELSVSSCTCNRYGNIIITGSKDTTVKFWDVSSGVCVKSLTTHFGEVTSVEASEQGDKLLVASKDNSNRLWDLRMLRPTQKFRGHYNTSKNFVKANFGPSNKIVMGGSEDGNIFLWDIDTGKIVQRLRGHNGTAYRACWNNSQSLMASCGDDGLVKVWWYDAQERGHE
ncbi:WD repeat-containing protein 5B-like [Zophobas morio]|uniref:WD repeat-containing protein 5B-like n=1 Tax=Zophobas morio TaxID=2755281 RepID=UPI0030830555